MTTPSSITQQFSPWSTSVIRSLPTGLGFWLLAGTCYLLPKPVLKFAALRLAMSTCVRPPVPTPRADITPSPYWLCSVQCSLALHDQTCQAVRDRGVRSDDCMARGTTIAQ